MAVFQETIRLSTRGHCDIHDITEPVAGAVARSGIRAGVVNVAALGSTLGVTTIEFEPGAVADLRRALETIAPQNDDYAHNVKQVVPFLGVTDMQRTLRFYLDGLGFVMRNQWLVEGKVRWCLLEFGGASLMLQEFSPDGHAPHHPGGDLGRGVSLEFICADALAIYRQAAARGLAPSEPCVGNAMWVTTLSDPDGYRIEFESPTGVPAETRLSEVKD